MEFDVFLRLRLTLNLENLFPPVTYVMCCDIGGKHFPLLFLIFGLSIFFYLVHFENYCFFLSTLFNSYEKGNFHSDPSFFSISVIAGPKKTSLRFINEQHIQMTYL